MCRRVLQCAAVCCSVLQCVAVCVAVCCSVLQCVLQCVAMFTLELTSENLRQASWSESVDKSSLKKANLLVSIEQLLFSLR